MEEGKKEEKKKKCSYFQTRVSRVISPALSSYQLQGQTGPFIPVNWTQERAVTNILILCGFLARHT